MNLGQFLHGKPQADAPGAIGHAWAYEAFTALAFAGRRRRIFHQLVDLAGITAGDRVLDVGCGPGYLTALAAAASSPGGRAEGIDPSAPMIEQARRTRATDNCSFRLGKAESLDAEEGAFDVVVSSFAVHHMPEPMRAKAFTEMYRVLRPGGRLLVADFRPPSGRFGRHLVGVLAGEGMRDNPVERIAPMVAAAGFDSVAVREMRPFLHCVRAAKPGDDA